MNCFVLHLDEILCSVSPEDKLNGRIMNVLIEVSENNDDLICCNNLLLCLRLLCLLLLFVISS